MRRSSPGALLRPLVQVALLWLLAVGSALGGTLQVEILDVGQGDGILIRSPGGKTVLIDAGVKGADVVGQLRARGVDHLDLAIGTHPHADHVGGMADVLRAFPPKVYTDNGLPHTTQTYEELMAVVEEGGIAYRPAERGQSFSLDDGIRLEVLFPTGIALRNTRSDLNSNSVVVRLTHGAQCFLFVGDSEEPTEQALHQAGLEPCGVLKVAHHGSEHSSTPAFLRAVEPGIALISVGVDNRYGHPDPAALERLAAVGATIYRTDTMGALLLESDGQHVTVTPQGKDPAAVAGTRPRLPTLPAAVSPPGPRLPAAAATPPDGAGAPGGPEAEASAPALDPSCRFVASRSSQVYHPADCHVVARIYAANRVCFESAAAAEATGRTRSRVCPDPAP